MFKHNYKQKIYTIQKKDNLPTSYTTSREIDTPLTNTKPKKYLKLLYTSSFKRKMSFPFS